MIDPEEIYHVLPRNDLEPHCEICEWPPVGDPFCPCKCKPTYQKFDNGSMVIIHNSFDGREIREEAAAAIDSHEIRN